MRGLRTLPTMATANSNRCSATTTGATGARNCTRPRRFPGTKTMLVRFRSWAAGTGATTVTARSPRSATTMAAAILARPLRDGPRQGQRSTRHVHPAQRAADRREQSRGGLASGTISRMTSALAPVVAWNHVLIPATLLSHFMETDLLSRKDFHHIGFIWQK